MKLIGLHLGAINGELFFQVYNAVVGLRYGTPAFNDYNEWNMDEIKIYDKDTSAKFIADNDSENLKLSINVDEVDALLVKDLIDEWLENEDPSDRMKDHTYFDLGMKYVYWRAPTEEELKESGNELSAYKIGEYIFIEDEENTDDWVKLEEFKPAHEIEKFALVALKDLIKNKDIVFAQSNAILM